MVTFETNADGTVIGTLSQPVKVDGEEMDRFTIPKLKGKHLFGAPPLNSVGSILLWASKIVQPRGLLEEMEPEDAVEVGDFLFRSLNKRQPTGAPGSD